MLMIVAKKKGNGNFYLKNGSVLDVNLNGVVFEGMKLAGTIMIVNGFLLVLLPENWPDYLTRLLR